MPPDWYRTVLVYAVLVLAGGLGAISDAILNQWAKTSQTMWLLAAYCSWIVVATLLGLILKWQYFTFGGAVVLFLLVNSAGAVLLDYQMFGEKMTTWQWAGIALAIAAMCCIEIGRAKSHDEIGHAQVTARQD
jgi:multidrug transporter EmrE-like cation transporter